MTPDFFHPSWLAIFAAGFALSTVGTHQRLFVPQKAQEVEMDVVHLSFMFSLRSVIIGVVTFSLGLSLGPARTDGARIRSTARRVVVALGAVSVLVLLSGLANSSTVFFVVFPAAEGAAAVGFASMNVLVQLKSKAGLVEEEQVVVEKEEKEKEEVKEEVKEEEKEEEEEEEEEEKEEEEEEGERDEDGKGELNQEQRSTRGVSEAAATRTMMTATATARKAGAASPTGMRTKLHSRANTMYRLSQSAAISATSVAGSWIADGHGLWAEFAWV